MSDAPDTAAPVNHGPRRMLVAILVFQLGLGLLLFLGDLRGGNIGLALPGFGPTAPGMDQPVRPGDQTRRFEPMKSPTLGPDSGPLPDRLIATGGMDGTWLLEGAIAPGDADRIAGQLSEAAVTPALVRINSSGGSVTDALALGRRLRELGVATEVGRGQICLSACPYLFAAGITRSAEGQVGVHQHFFGESTILPASFAVEDIQRGQSNVMAYLDEMGIDPLLMRPAMATPPDEIYILTPEELVEYRLVTGDGA